MYSPDFYDVYGDVSSNSLMQIPSWGHDMVEGGIASSSWHFLEVARAGEAFLGVTIPGHKTSHSAVPNRLLFGLASNL